MSEERRAYDLVVLGGGPAGIVGATTAAALGKAVALVDSHHELGGAGANTGTVPSKTLRETSLALSAGKSRNLYGVDLSLRREATVADFLRHERNVKTGLSATLARQLEANKVASTVDWARSTTRIQYECASVRRTLGTKHHS